MKTKKDFEKLITDYPNLFKGQPRCGIYVSNGWFNLVDRLCSELEHHIQQLPEELRNDCYCTQIKEKFGGLRFYVNHSTPFMDGAIALAECMSYSICEECGAPGTRRMGGYIQSLCNKHFKAREKRKQNESNK